MTAPTDLEREVARAIERLRRLTAIAEGCDEAEIEVLHERDNVFKVRRRCRFIGPDDWRRPACGDAAP